jgi:hypothetical protein
MFEDATPRRCGPPTLRREPSVRAVPTTPMDRDGLGRLRLPAAWQPSPTARRVGVHDFTFEACSGFTGVTARTVAGIPFVCLDPKASARPVTPPHRLGGYRGEPKTPRTDLSSAGPLHPRGALAVPGFPHALLQRSHNASLLHDKPCSPYTSAPRRQHADKRRFRGVATCDPAFPGPAFCEPPSTR